VVYRIYEEQVLLGVAGDAGGVQLPGARRELGHGADEGRGRVACNLVPRRPCALLLDATASTWESDASPLPEGRGCRSALEVEGA